ncbi:MAG: P-loop NTPase [Chlamydiales bacterium]|nr:P-loop NTPase [Chlamydiales bacterium]
MKRIAEKTVAVGAGKGGVGKSTVTVNLACALAQRGLRVGLLDADLYGPSIPIMLGLRQLSPRTQEEGKAIPFAKFGVHTISLGFFIDESRSILWRGPMLHEMLQKMINGVAWPELDLLLIDLPPGTGDVPLSLKQLLNLTGALVVTTPQPVALQDVIKSINAFDQLQIPLLGVIENFSGYTTPDGKRYTPFGEGLGERLAENLAVPCLGKVTLQEEIREGGDNGIPQPQSFIPLADALIHVLYQ